MIKRLMDKMFPGYNVHIAFHQEYFVMDVTGRKEYGTEGSYSRVFKNHETIKEACKLMKGEMK